MDAEKALVHFGIMGMRWGHRKSSSSGEGGSSGGQSDHLKFKALRKKHLKDMSDSEIRDVSERLRLIQEYKSSGARGKKVSSMSNADLIAATKRGKLEQERWRYGLRSSKEIRKMSDKEVASMLDRALLERAYRNLDRDRVLAGGKFLEEFLSYNPNRTTTVGNIAGALMPEKKKQ